MRDDETVRFQAPKVTQTMKALSAALVGVWLLQVLSGGGGGDRFGAFRWFTLKPGAVIDGLQLWRVLTYAVLGDPSDVVAIALDVMLLLIFGSALEERVGRARTLAAMLGASAFGALVVLAVSRVDLALLHAPVVGPAAAMSALIVAWGIQRADERLSFFGAFELRGRHFAMAAAAMTVLSFLINRSGAHVASVAGLVAGIFVARIGPRGGSAPRRKPAAPHLRVVKPDPKHYLN
ncbi:MAG: rhomboid family intramembrane serine protease [Polyangiales bacterium]